MIHLRQFMNGSAWSMGGTMLSQAIGLAVLAYMAHYLDAREFGLVAISLLMLDLTRDFILSGLPDYLVRERQWRPDVANACFAFQVMAGTAMTVLALLAGSVVGRLVDADIGLAMQGLAFIYVVEAAGSMALARLRHNVDYRSTGIAQVLGAIAMAVIALVALRAGSGFMTLVYSRIGAALVVSATHLAQADWRPRPPFSLAPLRPLVRIATNIIGVRLLGVLNVKATDLIIGLLGGPAVLGAYQLASRMLNFVLQTILATLQTISLSLFGRLDGLANLQSGLVRVLTLSGLAVFPVAIGLASVSPEFVILFFGPGWDQLVLPAAVLMLACLPATLNYLLYPVLVKIDRTDVSLGFMTRLTVIGALLTFVAVGHGLLAVALAFTARTTIGSIMAITILRRELQLPVSRLLAALAAPTSGALAVAIGTMLVRPQLADLSDLSRLLALMATGIIVYVPVCAVLFWQSRATFVALTDPETL